MREEPHLAADLADSGIHSDMKSSCCLGWIKKSICYLAVLVREDKVNWLKLLLAPAKATRKLLQESKIFGLAHTQDAQEYNYIVERHHQLCYDYAVRRDYSSPGHTSSTSTTLCAATTRRPDSTGSTAPMLCIQTRCLDARLLVGRSHWLSPCTRSLRPAARLLVVRIAPALLCLCYASGRAVSPLDFSSVSRTGSRRAPGHCVPRRDYSTSGLHRLYCAYAVHSDAPYRRLTSRRSVALALAVHPVTACRGATTRRPDCTGSTVPMLCIRTRRLTARLLVGQSHWLSLCVRSLRPAARLLVVRIAPALPRLCRASGRAVSTLDLSSVGRTGSRHAPGHCVPRRDCSSSGLHRLYSAYAVHLDAPSRR
jgi:hypothetical protein